VAEQEYREHHHGSDHRSTGSDGERIRPQERYRHNELYRPPPRKKPHEKEQHGADERYVQSGNYEDVERSAVAENFGRFAVEELLVAEQGGDQNARRLSVEPCAKFADDPL